MCPLPEIKLNQVPELGLCEELSTVCRRVLCTEADSCVLGGE